MSSSGASARRATFDAIALALSFLAVDAIIVTAVLADLVDPAQGIVTILALAAVVLLLFRDDVAEAIATGNEKLGLAVDDEPVRRALDSLVRPGRLDGRARLPERPRPPNRHGRPRPVGLVPGRDAQPRVPNRAPRPSAPPRSVAPRRGRRLGHAGPVPGAARRPPAPPRRRVDHGRRAPRGVAQRADASARRAPSRRVGLTILRAVEQPLLIEGSPQRCRSLRRCLSSPSCRCRTVLGLG